MLLRGRKKENKLTSKVRKSETKFFTVYDKRWILRQIKNNPKLSPMKMAAEIENHLHKKVNPEKFQRGLRQNDFYGKLARKSSSLLRKIREFKWNSQKTIYGRVQNSRKHLNLLMKTSVMYLEQMDIIMCGEYSGKNFREKKLSNS
jgi:hypothetical protein